MCSDCRLVQRITLASGSSVELFVHADGVVGLRLVTSAVIVDLDAMTPGETQRVGAAMERAGYAAIAYKQVGEMACETLTHS